MFTNNSNLDTEDIESISKIFDLLAKYDSEDTKKYQAFSYVEASKEVKKDSSIIGGESFLESLETTTTNT